MNEWSCIAYKYNTVLQLHVTVDTARSYKISTSIYLLGDAQEVRPAYGFPGIPKFLASCTLPSLVPRQPTDNFIFGRAFDKGSVPKRMAEAQVGSMEPGWCWIAQLEWEKERALSGSRNTWFQENAYALMKSFPFCWGFSFLLLDYVYYISIVPYSITSYTVTILHMIIYKLFLFLQKVHIVRPDRETAKTHHRPVQ